jgi:hypothetical protein
MSWGVSAIGRAPAVGAAIERQFESGKCAEPEESIRQAARALIAASIAAQDSVKGIRVQANDAVQALEKVADTVLAYRPKSKQPKPRKRRRANARNPKTGGR